MAIPGEGAVSYERGTPVNLKPLALNAQPLQGYLAHKKTPTPPGPP
jgi:hypothetical protein